MQSKQGRCKNYFVGTFAVLAMLCLVSLGQAATATWTSPNLVILLADGGDTVSVTVAGGQVKVNGADPTGGPVLPADVQSITVTAGLGNGPDFVDLSEVTLANGFTHAALDNPGGTTQSIQVDVKGGDDVCTGTAFADRLQGKGGADELWGGPGDDRLDGHFNDNPNTDSDEIHGGPGDDTIYGYSGDDILYGDAGVDSIFGGNDADMIYGGDDGDLLLRGGPQSADVGAVDGIDTIYGGAGDEVMIRGDNGNDILYGDAGNDIMQGDADHDEIHGGADNDTINGGGGNDMLFGDGGVDNIDGDGGNDEIHGGDGDDILTGDNGLDDIYPEAGSDTVIGTPDNNDDTIYITAPAAGETDTIDGGVHGTGDTLEYDAQGNSVTGGATPAGSIMGVGIGTVNYVDIEFINLSNVPLPVISLALDVVRGADLLLMPTDGATDGFGQVDISNTGLVDLVISAITIENNVGGFFSFAGGPPATPTTVTIGAGTSPTLNLGILFSAAGTDTTATLKILSNTGGGTDVETTVELVGTAFSTLIWDAEASTDFTVANNWNPNAAAGFLTDYRIELVVDGTAPSAAINSGQIRLGVTGGRFGKLTVSGGTLETTGTTPHLRVDGPGEVAQSGGVVNIAGNLRLGWDGSDIFPALYTMSNGTMNTPNGEIGRANNSFGKLVMTGGTVNSAGNFWLAFLPDTKGEVDISGGQLNAAIMQVGQKGEGSLNITGTAEVNLVNALLLGNNDIAAEGSFSMNSGTLNTGAIRVGLGSLTGWSWTGGTIAASVEVEMPGETLTNDGGTLVVGGTNSISALAFTDTGYTQSATGIMNLEVDGTTNASDSVNFTTGSATLDGTIDVSLFGSAPISTTSYDVVTASGGGTITYGSGLAITLPDPDWSITEQSASKLTITFTTIQDPLAARSWLLYN